jgi:hypothetical protein
MKIESLRYCDIECRPEYDEHSENCIKSWENLDCFIDPDEEEEEEEAEAEAIREVQGYAEGEEWEETE